MSGCGMLKLEQIVRRGFAHGHLRLTVVRKVDEAVVNRFRIGIAFECDFIRILRLGYGMKNADLAQDLDESHRCGFPRRHARVITLDISRNE